MGPINYMVLQVTTSGIRQGLSRVRTDGSQKVDKGAIFWREDCYVPREVKHTAQLGVLAHVEGHV